MSTEKLIAGAERLLFSWRRLWLFVFVVLSVLLFWQAMELRPDASMKKMIPVNHPFIQQYLRYESELRPLSNSIRIAVEVEQGDIYNGHYLTLLKEISDEVFFTPGIDRGNLRSLATPNTQWIEAAEDGLRSGTVMPSGFKGSDEEVERIRANVQKANLMGQLVANDHRSTIIQAPLLEVDPDSGQPLDYAVFSKRLEERVRLKFESQGVKIHIVGFAKLVGDLIDGARAVGLFFLLTVVLTAGLVYAYSRCWRSTLATVGCCLLAVVWHLGVMHLLGFGLDPYLILVPFLTFAIGVSHAMQNINTLASESVAGASVETAARATFRLLFIPGTVALLCNIAGFSTMLIIDIGVIRELAISASVGVGVIIFTKMFLLPIVMSYSGLSSTGLRIARRRESRPHRLAAAISRITRPPMAVLTVAIVVLLSGWAFMESRHLQIGDLEPGAPELRADSVYNRDSAWFAKHYDTSSDAFVVMVKTPESECGSYPVASLVTRLQWALEETPGAQSTLSLFDVMKRSIAGSNGGNLKWATVSRDRYISNAAHKAIPQSLYNTDCSMLPVIVFLNDHKAATLDDVVSTVSSFASAHPLDGVQILMGAGNSGIEAATNAVVRKAWLPMLLVVYFVVGALLLIEFRSVKITVCVLMPLLISSVLCEAVMARLGLGVKVATLPVITLGVGIGVDYGIYIYNRLLGFLKAGLSLQEAYYRTMRTTGLAVLFTGFTLAAGVLTWGASQIKFQADMGLLLAFMFLWNMIGAVLLFPALTSLLRVQYSREADVSADQLLTKAIGCEA